jgi:predicted flap endonuclease-1-like 5' DNA nuclease
MSRTNAMRSLVEQLLVDRTARRDAVATLRTSVTEFLDNLQMKHMTMAVTMHSALATKRTECTEAQARLATETDAFRSSIRDAHAATTQAQKAKLAENHAKLTAEVAQMMADTADFRNDIQAAHATMTTALDEKLVADRTRLTTETAKVTENAAILMKGIRADITGAAEAWRVMSAGLSRSSHKPTGGVQKASVTVAQPPVTSAAEPEISVAKSTETSADDHRDLLTEIHGIGSVSQDKLYAAGITTYAQLAAAQPEEIRSALGPNAARLANLKEWVEQARQLTGGI